MFSISTRSDLDNIAFELAKNGYFGNELTNDAHFVQNITFEKQTLFLCYIIPLRPLILFGLFLITLCSFIPVALFQVNGKYFRQKFPNCAIDPVDIVKIGDGSCDGEYMCFKTKINEVLPFGIHIVHSFLFIVGIFKKNNRWIIQ